MEIELGQQQLGRGRLGQWRLRRRLLMRRRLMRRQLERGRLMRRQLERGQLERLPSHFFSPQSCSPPLSPRSPLPSPLGALA